MRAVRITGPGDVAVADLAVPDPAPGELRIKVRWAALCNTDRKLARGGTVTARVPGHEVAGETADGAAVAVHPDIGCGACAVCATGMTNRCACRRSIGIDRDGGLAEWVVAPAAQAVAIPDIALRLGPLLEPLACCVHAVALLPLQRVRTAAVVGAGAMGLLAMWTLQARGVRVVVSQRSAERRRLAADLGADAALASDDDPAAALGGPPDAVVVTAPGSEPLRWALRHVTVGGAVHAFAGAPGGAEIDANAVHYRHLTLLGSTGSTLDDYRAAVALVREGRVDLGRLPVTTIGLEDVPSALLGEPDRRHLRTLVAVDGGDP